MTLKAFVIDCAKYLHDTGEFEVYCICDHDEDFAKSLPDYIHYIPVSMKRGISLSAFKAIRQMKKIFKQHKFDIVQYSTPNASLYASMASKSAKVPVRNYHLMGLRYLGAKGIGRFVLKVLEKWTCKNSTHIECVSPSNMSMGIEEKLFDSEKVTVVWNGSSAGVNLQRFSIEYYTQWREEKRKQYGLTDKDFVFGFVGRITKDKGINELLSAFKQLREESHCKLVLIGRIDIDHGLSKETLEEIERGECVLHIEQTPEIEKYYPMLDVLVLPSYREGFGNVVIEAEAMGVPVIVSNIPGPMDAMKEGKTGFTFTCKDVFSLKETMQKIMSMDLDKLSLNATTFAKECFDEQVMYQYILKRKQKLFNESTN